MLATPVVLLVVSHDISNVRTRNAVVCRNRRSPKACECAVHRPPFLCSLRLFDLIHHGIRFGFTDLGELLGSVLTSERFGITVGHRGINIHATTGPFSDWAGKFIHVGANLLAQTINLFLQGLVARIILQLLLQIAEALDAILKILKLLTLVRALASRPGTGLSELFTRLLELCLQLVC